MPSTGKTNLHQELPGCPSAPSVSEIQPGNSTFLCQSWLLVEVKVPFYVAGGLFSLLCACFFWFSS